ncbi:MAG: glycosyltransferase family 8 protein [Planctomycetaceae bacterium]|nr:glycosyltransferase family 8 protein [Planctomycetaceae bacterium]
MTENCDSDDGVKVILPPEPINPAFAENNVPVFLGCDDRFFAPALTTIASVMRHASPQNNYDIFIIQDGIAPARLKAAVQWMRRYPNASLRFVDIRPLVEAEGKEAFATNRAISYAAYFRIFAPEVFGAYDKIAYLDSDVVLFGDVADFYHIPLDGMPVGACHDYVTEEQSRVDPGVGKFWREKLGMDPGTPYFFSGGLVMDLSLMRERGDVKAFLEKNRFIGGSNLPEQDVMNSVLQGNVTFIDCEWNYLDWWYDADETSRNFRLMNPADRMTVRMARPNVKVLHYAEKKPWTRDYVGTNAQYYWENARLTPFYEESVMRLKDECALWPTLKRKAVVFLQENNFRFRLLFCPKEKRGRYEGRLNNLFLRKRGLDRQRRLVRELQTGISIDPLQSEQP